MGQIQQDILDSIKDNTLFDYMYYWYSVQNQINVINKEIINLHNSKQINILIELQKFKNDNSSYQHLIYISFNEILNNINATSKEAFDFIKYITQEFIDKNYEITDLLNIL